MRFTPTLAMEGYFVWAMLDTDDIGTNTFGPSSNTTVTPSRSAETVHLFVSGLGRV